MILTFDTDEQATNWARDWLRRQGCSVQTPEERAEWITPEQARERYAPHLSPGGFHKRLNRGPFFMERLANGHGRRSEIQINPALIAHLAKPKTPGRRTDLHGD